MTQGNRDPRRTLGWTAWWLFVVLSDLVAGHYLTLALFRFTGEPNEVLGNVVFGLVSLGVFALAWVPVTALLRRLAIGRQNQREKSFRATLEALAQIATGDFDVVLNTDDFGPYDRFVDSINRMAKELSAMETLRVDFVSNVSHEIQSPLTSIAGYAELLENDGLSPEERKAYLGIIKAESARLSNLGSNLLKLSSLDAGATPLSRQTFRLDRQLQQTVILLDPQWSAKGLNVDAELAREEIAADEELLSQVWINLLNNAIKFTPNGGSIHISLTASQDALTVTIADSGIGISQEDLPRVFERFFKADKARDRSLGGNGLGLSLVKKIVELHGGKVSVKSDPGIGTSFAVTLPRYGLQ